MKIGYINQEIKNSIKGVLSHGFKKGFKLVILDEYEDNVVIGNKVSLVRLIDEDKDNFINGYYDYDCLKNSLQLIASYKITTGELKNYNFRLYKDKILIDSWIDTKNECELVNYLRSYMEQYKIEPIEITALRGGNQNSLFINPLVSNYQGYKIIAEEIHNKYREEI